MKDWGWENRESGTELGLFLDLKADFSLENQNLSWFRDLQPQHYALYDGPFKTWTHQPKPVCAFLEKPFYQELVQSFELGERVSYASFYHYVYLQASRLVFVRAWGKNGTDESDKLILQSLLKQGIEIGDWLIQDLDYGNEWVHDHGTATFMAYVGDSSLMLR